MRLYAPDELRADGYPQEWHDGEHGSGKWSPCDGRCTHPGPCRWTHDGVSYEVAGPAELNEAGLAWPGNLEAKWRVLTVHHLDGNKANCRWWNLASLCQRCHLTIQGRVRMERTWPWEHTEWFKPYVAGFYAWSYLGEDLTRDQTMDRLDELLDLERAVPIAAAPSTQHAPNPEDR